MRRVAICGTLALLTVVGSGAIAISTFRPSSIEEPKFQGLLANAPALIGDAHSIASRFGAYRAELQGLVTNVSKLYETVNTLPVYEPSPGTIRVLHVSDLHLNPSAWSVISTVVNQFHINLVIDTGDINDWGSTTESSFVDPIGSLGVPYVYIRGNHDSATTARAVSRQPNAIVLENQIQKVDGLTIAGIGDPRFTPDKTTREPDTQSGHQTIDYVYASGEKLASTIRAYNGPVDIALVHDPASAGALDGTVPLVLAGHLHHRQITDLAGGSRRADNQADGRGIHRRCGASRAGGRAADAAGDDRPLHGRGASAQRLRRDHSRRHRPVRGDAGTAHRQTVAHARVRAHARPVAAASARARRSGATAHD